MDWGVLMLELPGHGPGPEVSCGVARWDHTGSVGIEGVQSGELLGGQQTGASLAVQLGVEGHGQGSPESVPAGTMLIGFLERRLGAVQGSPRLTLDWSIANRRAGDGRCTDMMNPHEFHANATLVRLLDL